MIQTNSEHLFDLVIRLRTINHELYSTKNEKVVGRFKIEIQDIWIDKFICFRSKAYSSKCNDENTNKLKSIYKSQSKHFKFGKHQKSLSGE